MIRLPLLIALLVGTAASTAEAADIDWAKVDRIFGKPAAVLPGGVHKWGLPRTDLKISVDGIVLNPSFALGSWIGLLPAEGGAMLMGDLVLGEAEVGPVMQRLIEGGIDITALHNHLLRTSPAVFYMHVGGHGDPVKLAETLRAGLSLSHTPFGVPPTDGLPPPSDLDTAAIESTLGFKGAANGGVYQFGIPRAESITAAGMAIPPSLGTAIAINFQPTGGGKAAITGDFVLLGSEVNPVLKSLRDHGIEVTALHSHMVDDSPHLFFMHFWAVDDAVSLAQRLRATLDLVNIKRSP
ncbi:MAG TPA: DUF1259 domain-containing protein [Steroidobacteraceae bacterium]|nr:DUF1259 domain-containing protein [Steroidobacteraceae bacterium]